jgi:hypothetical protein
LKLPNLADRLNAANEAKKAQLQRAKALAESPDRAERRRAREALVAARNARIAERRVAQIAAKERKPQSWRQHKRPRLLRERQCFMRSRRRAAREAERAERDAAEAAQRAATEAAEAAQREEILAVRRAGRKAKKRNR